MFSSTLPKKDQWIYFSLPFTFDRRNRYASVSKVVWYDYLMAVTSLRERIENG